MKLTQERLKELLDYDPETGIFTRKVRTSNFIRVGAITKKAKKDTGYLMISVDNREYRAHRLAFLFMEGYFPENDVDHIDRNRVNNKWNNLREVSRTCNLRNKAIQRNNTSGVIGVSWHKRESKWRATIKTTKHIHIGFFANLIDAAKARWEAEVKYNFPNCNTTSSAYMYLKEKGAI